MDRIITLRNILLSLAQVAGGSHFGNSVGNPSRVAGPGERQVLVTAMMEQSGPYPNFFPKMKFDTLKVMDITGGNGGLSAWRFAGTYLGRSVLCLFRGRAGCLRPVPRPTSGCCPIVITPNSFKTLTVPAAVTAMKINGGHPDHVGNLTKKPSFFPRRLFPPGNGAALGKP